MTTAGTKTAEAYAKLSAYLDTLNQHQKMMMAVYISQNGTPVYEHYAGFASVEQQIKIKRDTRFRIGSVTKTYTAVLIMQLMEDTKLSLATPLAKFFPEIRNADKITIRQLLSHRSGIKSFTDDSEIMNYMYEPQSPEDMIRRIAAFEPLFEPDSQQQYSNSNYVLLAYIVENLSKKPFSEVIKEKIVIPLGLNNTRFGGVIDVNQGDANSYRFEGHWSLHPESHMSIPHGAGAMVSSAKETNDFYVNLFSEKLVSPAILKSMITMQDGYGFGMFPMPILEQEYIGHDGGIDGFVSICAYNPKDRIAFTLLTNAANQDIGEVVDALLSSVYGKDFHIPELIAQPVEVSVESKEKLTGEFEDQNFPLDIAVFLEDDQLMAQATGQSSFPLTSYSETEYRCDTYGITIEFDAASEKDGKLHSFTFLQGSRKHLFKRKQLQQADL